MIARILLTTQSDFELAFRKIEERRPADDHERIRVAVKDILAEVEARGDEALVELSARFDERSSMHIAGSSGLGGDYQGDEAISGLFDRLTSACDHRQHAR